MLCANNRSTIAVSHLPSSGTSSAVTWGGAALQLSWDNAARNNPCICFSFQQRARFVCLSCVLGLLQNDLKLSRETFPT